MSDQNTEDQDLNDTGDVTVYCKHGDHGVPVPAFVITVIALIVAFFLGLTYIEHSGDSNVCKVSNAQATAQAEASKANMEYNTTNNKRIQALQIQVADDCVKIHGVPSFGGGNVGCTVTPEKK